MERKVEGVRGRKVERGGEGSEEEKSKQRVHRGQMLIVRGIGNARLLVCRIGLVSIVTRDWIGR